MNPRERRMGKERMTREVLARSKPSDCQSLHDATDILSTYVELCRVKGTSVVKVNFVNAIPKSGWFAIFAPLAQSVNEGATVIESLFFGS